MTRQQNAIAKGIAASATKTADVSYRGCSLPLVGSLANAPTLNAVRAARPQTVAAIADKITPVWIAHGRTRHIRVQSIEEQVRQPLVRVQSRRRPRLRRTLMRRRVHMRSPRSQR